MTSTPDTAVRDLDVAAYTVPTDRPEGDGTLTWDSVTLVLVRARAGAHRGLGWTYGPRGCAPVVRDLLAPRVVGRCALDVPAALEDMVRAVRNAGRPGIAGYAISAVETALWDLKARLLDLPLYRLLGAMRDAVPLYGSGGLTTYDDTALRDQLAQWVHGQGFGRVKIKIGESWGQREERDVRRLRAARDTIGPDTELYADANGGYTTKQALRVGRHMAEEVGLRWFEEPVSSDDLAGLRLLRETLPLDVTAGEYGCTVENLRRMCAAGAVDCLQIDVTRCGGVLEFLRAAAVAAAHGLDVSAHCAPYLHRHVALGTPRLRHLEWFHTHVRVESLLFDGADPPHNGHLSADPTRPGHGLDLREPDARRYRVDA